MTVSATAAPARRGKILRPSVWAAIAVALAGLAGCAVGPNYSRPTLAVPDHFKESVEWRRAQPGSALTLRDDWWRGYHDAVLDRLVEQALMANQSIAAAEAAYRVAQATVRGNVAALYPTVTADLGASRSGIGAGVPAVAGGNGVAATGNLVSLGAVASWEPDLWGSVRRSIEAARASAQASDAQLAGVRLLIAASVVADYFALRQADGDIALLQSQSDIDARILHMTQASWRGGAASHDDVLAAQNTLDATVAALQSTQGAREQDEHAIAALLGLPPAAFSLLRQPGYAFTVPPIPPMLPSQLLLRRYDVVSAERTAAAANARIGVAEAAFFPTFTLSAQGGFDSSTFAQLLSYSDRLWTLGPDLAATLFDGGARNAAVASAHAAYDEDVAVYRNTVIAAFQGVEDSLSSMHHLGVQASAQALILRGNEQLYASARAQRRVGASSEQNLLGAKLALLKARQNLVDARAVFSESSVTLIKNLGGGWQWSAAGGSPAPVAAAATQTRSRQ